MSRSPREVHVQIRRVVIDAAALGTLPRELLLEQLSTAITERMSGAPIRVQLTPLATRVADVVVPTVTKTIGGRHG